MKDLRDLTGSRWVQSNAWLDALQQRAAEQRAERSASERRANSDHFRHFYQNWTPLDFKITPKLVVIGAIVHHFISVGGCSPLCSRGLLSSARSGVL